MSTTNILQQRHAQWHRYGTVTVSVIDSVLEEYNEYTEICS